MLSFLFPPICPLCAKELLDKGERICKICSKKQIFIKEPTCYSCGKSMKNQEKEYCSDCRQHPKNFERGMGLCIYQKPVTDDIYTTGSTAEAVTTALKQLGVQEVYVFCIAIGKGFS